MKMFLPTILLVAASSVALGQTAKCIGDHCTFSHTYCNPGFHTNNIARAGDNYTFQCEQDKPKTPQPKTSHSKPLVKPDVVAQGSKICVADGVGCYTSEPKMEVVKHYPVDYVIKMDMSSQPGEAAAPVDPSCSGIGDGTICNLSETAKPVETCPPTCRGIAYTNDPPQSKRANGPPEPSKRCVADECESGGPQRLQITEVTGTVPAENCIIFGGSVCLDANDGSKAVMLGYQEYTHLQQLRASVVDEERRLAVKYGAFLFDAKCAAAPTCISMWNEDHYEYHGQFLLIDKASSIQRVSY